MDNNQDQLLGRYCHASNLIKYFKQFKNINFQLRGQTGWLLLFSFIVLKDQKAD